MVLPQSFPLTLPQPQPKLCSLEILLCCQEALESFLQILYIVLSLIPAETWISPDDIVSLGILKVSLGIPHTPFPQYLRA